MNPHTADGRVMRDQSVTGPPTLRPTLLIHPTARGPNLTQVEWDRRLPSGGPYHVT